jgi:Xaa-Pro aminopeptidase
MMRIRPVFVLLFAFMAVSPAAYALEKQPAGVCHARRAALAAKLQGGIAVLFALPESELDFTPYRQDSDFYYLTGWTEPGAALLIVADSSQPPALSTYKEILYLPTRDLQAEKYTGAKMDATTPGAAQAAGVDDVAPLTELPATLNQLIKRNSAPACPKYLAPARLHGCTRAA